MEGLKDALLNSIKTDAIVVVNDIEGNISKRAKILTVVRLALSKAGYKIVCDMDGGEIYVQY